MTKQDHGRLSREDWLAHALEVLADEGAVGLRVEPLARSLGVTPGSFYWHFRDRDDLYESLIAYWETELTHRNSELLAQVEGDARDQLHRLLEIIYELDLNRYDAAVRAWASSDERAAEAVRRVDARRLEFVTGLFRKMGFDREQSDLRGRISYYYAVGEETISVKVAEEAREKLLRLRCLLLTGPHEPGNA